MALHPFARSFRYLVSFAGKWHHLIIASGVIWLAAQSAGAQAPAGETLPWEELGRSLLADGGAAIPWRTIVTVTLAGLVPMVLLLTTSFVRLTIVLTLLRQALGSTQLLSHQVTTALALVLTVTIMAPCWRQAYESGVRPLVEGSPGFTVVHAWQEGSRPIHGFMARQLEASDGAADVRLFWEYNAPTQPVPSSYAEIPLTTLMPAFLLSELRTAFFIGFRIYLPFLVIDLVTAALATLLGLGMLPPQSISLPLKLIAFVLVDGWNLIVGSLLHSFATLT